MIDPAVLALLVCPLTHQPLRMATPPELAGLGLEAALVRADGRLAYPILDGMPVLLPDAGRPLEAGAT